jgi:peptidoglycan/LPS O-acetylase OafA/YrhL
MISLTAESAPLKTDTLQTMANHLAYLDGLRALSALYVLIHHAILQISAGTSYPYLVRPFVLFFAQGRYAVDVFIVISGFCLMLPVIRNQGFLKGNYMDFLRRRARRILPAYYLALALSLVLIYTLIGKKTGTNWDITIPVTSRDLITHLTLTQDLFTDTIFKINHTFWSISVECHIYLLFPLLVLLTRKYGAAAVTVLAVVLSLVLWKLLGKTSLNVYGMSPHYLGLFAFGMLAAQIAFSQVKLWTIPVVLAAIGAYLYPIIGPDFTAGLCAAALLAVVASGKFTIGRKFLCWPPLVFIGTFAYSIYLIHAPLLQLLSQYVISPLHLPALQGLVLLLAAGIPVIISGSYFFYVLAERPFLNKSRL